MILIKTAAELQKWMDKKKQNGSKIGFVPTMGALHNGHISLIINSKSQKLLTVSSIFVNPTQFNDLLDFEKYPQTIENDIVALEKAGTDVLFLPGSTEVYPNGTQNLEHYELGELEQVLEGQFRPGHFQGVCQVVYRLLQLVQPNYLFLGQKDFQQCMVIRKLIQLTSIQTSLVVCPTLRETSGLAMSSRNMRLSQNGIQKASLIYQVLQEIANQLEHEPVGKLLETGKQKLLASGFDHIDYLDLVSTRTLLPVDHWDPAIESVILIAAFLEGVRLIDNLPLVNDNILLQES